MSSPQELLAAGLQPGAAPAPELAELEFSVLGARPLRHAAVPAMMLDLEISDPREREIYMIGLTVQLMIEPARRDYDEPTRERLEGLFGPPERWAMTTRSLVWARLDVVVPAFRGTSTVSVPLACSYDMEVASAKYLNGLPGGEVPLALHFNGIVYYENGEGALQMVLIPWSASIDYRLPVAVWRETVDHFYPNTGWVALRSGTMLALERERVARGLPTYDACLDSLLEGGGDV